MEKYVLDDLLLDEWLSEDERKVLEKLGAAEERHGKWLPGKKLSDVLSDEEIRIFASTLRRTIKGIADSIKVIFVFQVRGLILALVDGEWEKRLKELPDIVGRLYPNRNLRATSPADLLVLKLQGLAADEYEKKTGRQSTLPDTEEIGGKPFTRYRGQDIHPVHTHRRPSKYDGLGVDKPVIFLSPIDPDHGLIDMVELAFEIPGKIGRDSDFVSEDIKQTLAESGDSEKVARACQRVIDKASNRADDTLSEEFLAQHKGEARHKVTNKQTGEREYEYASTQVDADFVVGDEEGNEVRGWEAVERAYPLAVSFAEADDEENAPVVVISFERLRDLAIDYCKNNKIRRDRAENILLVIDCMEEYYREEAAGDVFKYIEEVAAAKGREIKKSTIYNILHNEIPALVEKLKAA